MKHILKAVAIAAAVAALACLVLEYWAELTHVLGALHDRMRTLCSKCCCRKNVEEEDIEDLFEAVAE